jgi:hypothetical protein
MHLNKHSATNGAVIYRAAEPEAFSHKEVCPYDREMLQKMSVMQVPGLGTNGKKSEIEERLFIFSSQQDVKEPKYGFESSQTYKTSVRHFYNMDQKQIYESFQEIS